MTIQYLVRLVSDNPLITNVIYHTPYPEEADRIYTEMVADILYRYGPRHILITDKTKTVFVDHTCIYIETRTIPDLPESEEHWHITCVSPAINLPPLLTKTAEKSWVHFSNMVWTVLAVNGANIVNEEPGKVTFDDGTMIHRYTCRRDCLKPISPNPQFPRE